MNEKLISAPHDEQLEQAVLGALLIGGSFDETLEHLAVEDWYFQRHQAIYAAMHELSKRNEVIDYLSVSRELETQGKLDVVGGKAYIAELMVDVVSVVNLSSHVKAVKELSLLRNLFRIGQSVTMQAESRKSSLEIATEAERQLFSAMWARQVRPWKSSADVMDEAIEHFIAMQKRGDAISGITTGLVDLDRMLGGWQQSDLVIVAARPSMGKTAFMCGAVLAAAENGCHVAVSSLEMSARQLASRMIAIHSHRDVFAINNGRLTTEGYWSVSQSAMAIGGLPIHYDDSGLVTMDQLRAKARQLRVKKELDVLFVDYLQLMGGKNRRDSRQVEVSEISRGLKLLAKELDITVVALSQLSRACEMREDKRPILSDLRESGSIEQDADIVIGLYRDEVYNDETVDKGIAEILVRKHRNGPIGDVRATFIDKSARFANLSVIN